MCIRPQGQPKVTGLLPPTAHPPTQTLSVAKHSLNLHSWSPSLQQQTNYCGLYEHTRRGPVLKDSLGDEDTTGNLFRAVKFLLSLII